MFKQPLIASKGSVMGNTKKDIEMTTDYITGETVPLVGAEENLQKTARRLVNEKGYAREDLRRSVPIELSIGAESYRSRLDLVVSVAGKSIMVIKCAAGSLGSREREALAGARLLESRPIPLSVVSDGENVIVLSTENGKTLGNDWEVLPNKESALSQLAEQELDHLSEDRKRKESLIFRTYDSMNVNVA